ncbi:unnamed protein product [Trifolium pratense]|uniref:Uncharacterized protein n=1 Tax=Trifolium pratense TaxID=57577 RepID=A0ACB0IXK6_TRIPR|nr:unnamed protein product [Trifolium pratense]
MISKYRACVRTQGAKVEMINNLFKPVSDQIDEGIIREHLIDFYTSSGNRKPDNIIIFRDGVSESQFNQVLNIELSQVIEGTSRPTHYHVLLDEIGFSPYDLQELVHSLSYVTKNEHQPPVICQSMHICFQGCGTVEATFSVIELHRALFRLTSLALSGRGLGRAAL